ncbi:MAG: peptide/nickel transport system substrate-binding protein [Sphingomonadales bacterium]|nr:peptide/nickel transport system substrate-binding protein [Sphingomonadales bacterium]
MLAECNVARKAEGMRPLIAFLFVPALLLGAQACRPQPQGPLRAVVIGGDPKLRDPALGPLPPPDAVLLQNVAQGLVRFDAAGNIVGGLAERWNVSDDGLSYIFRIASKNWSDGSKISAQQVARLLKRQVADRSRNPLKDSVGAIDDIVAMTDRVIEIRLLGPRPNLLALLAQPEFAILRGNDGTGPFSIVSTAGRGGDVHLSREIAVGDGESTAREDVLLAGAPPDDAVNDFARGKSDLLLGGTFADLPLATRVKLPRNALRFDPASGLFGLVPIQRGGKLDDPAVRSLLSQAIDRGTYVASLGVSGLTPRATLLEPGLDGMAAPVGPAWFGVPLADRLATLRADADRLIGKNKPVIKVALPQGPGADLLLSELRRDWGAIGLTVEQAQSAAGADFALIDEVAPSSSPAWFVRRFRCGAAPICDAQADQLMEAARQIPIPAQRYALLAQAAGRIDELQLFIPITAPVRWSLVSARVQGFAGNRYARHTLTDLQQPPGNQ